MSALRASGKLVPDKAEAAQVSKIVENLQAVEVARQKREGYVQARLAEVRAKTVPMRHLRVIGTDC